MLINFVTSLDRSISSICLFRFFYGLRMNFIKYHSHCCYCCCIPIGFKLLLTAILSWYWADWDTMIARIMSDRWGY